MYTFHVGYPRVRLSLGEAALREAIPTVLLTLSGEISGVNPLSLWLWGAVQPGEALQPERMLGMNAYTMMARNFDRMPVEQNVELYTKMSAIVRRGLRQHHTPDYSAFVAGMLADPARAEIFETGPLYPEDEWEYTIRVTHPQRPHELLEYQASVFRFEDDEGFLIVYFPRSSSMAAIEEVNSDLIQQFGEGDDTIVLRRGEPSHVPLRKRTSVPYRSYYPCFIQDPLWYLVDENEAHRLLTGMSVLNLHFFELFLSPIVRAIMGPIQESSAPRALKYFDFFTSKYLREEHEMHERYMQTLKRLAQIEDFNWLLNISRRLPIHINTAASMKVLTASETPFYACNVVLPWRYAPEIRLQFKSMVNFIYQDAMVIDTDKRCYQDTLVPANSEADAALMLLPLFATPPSATESGDADARHLWQMLWLLALLRVVEEGLSTDPIDTMWNPEDAFPRVRQVLALRYSPMTGNTVRSVTTEILATLEVLERKGKIERVKLLALLHSFMVTQRHLSALSNFLEQEIEIAIQQHNR